MSFADLAWARLGIDPLGGVRVVDARAFGVDAAGLAGPMLIAQADTRFVLSDVKLALLEVAPPDHRVTVLQRLGLPDEHVVELALEDLDRVVEPDHLTSVFVDTGELAVASEFARLVGLAERLRGPGGCPWDAKQTHHSLRRHVLEEAYEVAEAIEDLPPDAPGGEVDIERYDALEDELGDLLFQVVIQSVLAAEDGRVHHRRRRAPHPRQARAPSPARVRRGARLRRRRSGHQLGADQAHRDGCRSRSSRVSRPGCRRCSRCRSCCARPMRSRLDPGLAPPDLGDDEAVGRALATIVAAGKARDIDAESALAGWARRFRDRFQRMEALARERGIDLSVADPRGHQRAVERGLSTPIRSAPSYA